MRLRLAAATAGVVALVAAPIAGAGTAQEDELAERYAPVVRLVAQEEACGYGEAYLPADVDVLLGEPTVALRGPWGPDDLIRVAPTAADLAQGLYEHHLDFPGNALDPGCDYELWNDRVAQGSEPTVYAHVATDPGFPGKLALQYWFFYTFNDFNNKHEGDWEMVQLVFEADDVEGALATEPVEVGYSQHEGAERAPWDDDKLELVEGTHPVVHPAAGSHANYFQEALYLGRSAEQGVGCDDTSEPTFDLRPVVRTIPSDAGAARRAFPWIAYEGRWGELQEAFYNGPTGPNLKKQWTEPILWAEEDWRADSYAIPAGGVLGRARRTSSVARFSGARMRCDGRSTIPRECSWCWGSSWPSGSSPSPGRPGGRPRRSGCGAGGRRARSSPQQHGCTGGAGRSSSGSPSSSYRSRSSTLCSRPR